MSLVANAGVAAVGVCLAQDSGTLIVPEELTSAEREQLGRIWSTALADITAARSAENASQGGERSPDLEQDRPDVRMDDGGVEEEQADDTRIGKYQVQQAPPKGRADFSLLDFFEKSLCTIELAPGILPYGTQPGSGFGLHDTFIMIVVSFTRLIREPCVM